MLFSVEWALLVMLVVLYDLPWVGAVGSGSGVGPGPGIGFMNSPLIISQVGESPEMGKYLYLASLLVAHSFRLALVKALQFLLQAAWPFSLQLTQ